MGSTKRKEFGIIGEYEYKGIKFIPHHLVIARSLQAQQYLFDKLLEKTNELNIGKSSFETISLEQEKVIISNDKDEIIIEKNKEKLLSDYSDYLPIENSFYVHSEEIAKDVASSIRKYGKTVETSQELNSIYVNIVILTSTLLEALINLYISIKCLEIDKK